MLRMTVCVIIYIVTGIYLFTVMLNEVKYFYNKDSSLPLGSVQRLRFIIIKY